MRQQKLATFGIIFIAALVLLGLFLYKNYPQNISSGEATVKIAIIDSARIKNKSKPFLKVRELLESEHTKAHDEIAKQEQELRKEFEDLKRTKAEAAKMKELKEEFDKKLGALEQTVLQKREKLTKEFAKITSDLENQLKKIIQDIAQKQSIHIVLNKYIQETQAILYSSSALDITEEVIERLDKEVPPIQISQDKPGHD
jgi:Skp family chaperone for outer membrane proteins